jgi:hypothetical protein
LSGIAELFGDIKEFRFAAFEPIGIAFHIPEYFF